MNEQFQVNQTEENKAIEKERNFRQLEANSERKLAQERAARAEAEAEKERLTQEMQKKHRSHEEDEEDDDPYVDKRKLERKLAKFGQSTQSDIQKAMEMAKEKAKEELKQEMWLENNPDFYEVLQKADKLVEKAPQLAKSILQMPDSFERQKLVYNNIKAMVIDQPEQKKSSIQDKVDANRRSPYYQPSGVGTAPYATSGDFSPQGQKQAYEKMQQLKSKYGM